MQSNRIRNIGQGGLCWNSVDRIATVGNLRRSGGEVREGLCLQKVRRALKTIDILQMGLRQLLAAADEEDQQEVCILKYETTGLAGVIFKPSL
jgi:hypothetical protein